MIKKLEPRKYLVRVCRIDRRTGLQKDRRQVCHGTRRDAEQLERQLTVELAAGSKPTRTTLSDYARRWLELRAGRLKPATADKYAKDLGGHILPALGAYYLDAILPSDVAAFVTADAVKHAPVSAANRLRLLRVLAKDALAEELTPRYFCARVATPTVVGYQEDKPNLLGAAELGQVLAAIPVQWRALATTLAFTGLRWGEVTALQWEDLDFEAGTIRVRRANWRGEVVEPKTLRSRRTVPMVDELAELLVERRRRMVLDQVPGLTAGWVFPTAEGTLHRGTPLLRVLRRAIAGAGLDLRVTTHGLRRTFNDLCRRETSELVVRSMLGHVTEEMTRHYSQVDVGEKREAAAKVVRLVRKG